MCGPARTGLAQRACTSWDAYIRIEMVLLYFPHVNRSCRNPLIPCCDSKVSIVLDWKPRA